MQYGLINGPWSGIPNLIITIGLGLIVIIIGAILADKMGKKYAPFIMVGLMAGLQIMDFSRDRRILRPKAQAGAAGAVRKLPHGMARRGLPAPKPAPVRKLRPAAYTGRDAADPFRQPSENTRREATLRMAAISLTVICRGTSLPPKETVSLASP